MPDKEKGVDRIKNLKRKLARMEKDISRTELAKRPRIAKEIYVSGIHIEVRKKKMKNMYLSVKPPDGKVVISAPYRVSDQVIEEFAKERIEWIIRQKKRLEQMPQERERQYLSGEILYIWGKRYTLVLREEEKKRSFALCGDKAVLCMRGGSTAKQREAYMREQYRSMLKEETARLLPVWEARTGLHCSSWHTKYMKTRWGTCNTAKKRLWFNVQLAEKPLECLEYVIVHELVHTKIANHGKEFTAAMDQYMPEWREVKKRLNARTGLCYSAGS